MVAFIMNNTFAIPGCPFFSFKSICPKLTVFVAHTLLSKACEISFLINQFTHNR